MVAIPRTLLIVALIGAVLAGVAGVLAGGAATREAATRALAQRSLDELAGLAGLADEHGRLQRDEPMAVEVIADGGPLWVLDAVAAAVERSPHFRADGSPHLLRAELIDAPSGVALQLHLWRGGWELREPQPRRVWIAVWAAALAGVFGALAATYTRRLSVGLATAGVLAQLLLGLAPVPAELFLPQGLLERWAEGPLLARLLASIRAMTTLQIAVAAAVLAASLVLVGFDHRRSRAKTDDLGLAWAALAAVLGGFGGFAWIEAASRGSLFAACDLRFGAWAGWLVMLGLIAAWLPAIRVAREAWRAQRASAS